MATLQTADTQRSCKPGARVCFRSIAVIYNGYIKFINYAHTKYA